VPKTGLRMFVRDYFPDIIWKRKTIAEIEFRKDAFDNNYFAPIGPMVDVCPASLRLRFRIQGSEVKSRAE